MPGLFVLCGFNPFLAVSTQTRESRALGGFVCHCEDFLSFVIRNYSDDFDFWLSGLISAESSISQSPHLYQSSPSNSAGCCVRPEPFPQLRESAEQYLSQPQQIRSGCFGFNGIFFAISEPLYSRCRVTVILACRPVGGASVLASIAAHKEQTLLPREPLKTRCSSCTVQVMQCHQRRG